VSSVDQNTDRQLAEEHLDKTFTDKVSGKDRNRPELTRALDYVRDGDELVVHSMDRLARNLLDLQQIVQQCVDKGVKVRFLKEKLTFEPADDKNSPDYAMKTLMLQIMGAVAQFERALTKERQREGIVAAKKAGKFRGGQPKLTTEEAIEVRRLVGEGVAKSKVAKKFKVSRETVYQYLKAAS
jgi:DNA invertase Pin-like site-specific DNA recombinase